MTLQKQQKRGEQDRRAREPEAKADPSTAFGARHKANQDLRAQVQVAKEKGKGATASGQSHPDAAAAQATRPIWDPLKRVSKKKKKASQPAQASSSHHQLAKANANGGTSSRDQRELILISSDDEVGAPSTSAAVAVAEERVRIKKEDDATMHDATNKMLTIAAATVRDESPPLPPHPRIRIKPEPE